MIESSPDVARTAVLRGGVSPPDPSVLRIPIPLHAPQSTSNLFVGTERWIVLAFVVHVSLAWVLRRRLVGIDRNAVQRFVVVPAMAVLLIVAFGPAVAAPAAGVVEGGSTTGPAPGDIGASRLNVADGPATSGGSAGGSDHSHASFPSHSQSHDHDDSAVNDPGRPPKPGSTAAISRIYESIERRGVTETKARFGDQRNVDAGHGGHSHGHGRTNSHSISGVELDEPTNGQVCPAGAPVRHFTVHAIQVDIVYNKYGQHDPNGVMYVLERNKQKVLRQVRNAPDATIDDPDPNATTALVQPLTIRARMGECVKVTFHNDLPIPASMHMSGLPYNVDQSDGMAVGHNDPSFAAPDGSGNDTVRYTYYANDKGTHFFADGTHLAEHSDPERVNDFVSDPDMAGSLRSNGLFGALIVEPKGATWTDPQTGEPLRSGTKADIHLPDRPDYREFAVYYHDGQDIVNGDGTEPTWPKSDAAQSLYVMNYRGDPMGARLREDCPDCAKPEMFYSSWVHGDPGGGDLVFPAYLGDPIQMRLVGANNEENHVHHMHGHRWKSTPGDPKSNTIDSQTINPGATYESEFVSGFRQRSTRPNQTYIEAVKTGGAGYVQGSPGDYIFHCHLFPHYASGMWSIMRVFDKDTRSDDDRVDLQPLPDRDYQPNDTDTTPGSDEAQANADASVFDRNRTNATVGLTTAGNATDVNITVVHNRTRDVASLSLTAAESGSNTTMAVTLDGTETNATVTLALGANRPNTTVSLRPVGNWTATAAVLTANATATNVTARLTIRVDRTDRPQAPDRRNRTTYRVSRRAASVWVPEGETRRRMPQSILDRLDNDPPPAPTEDDPGFWKFIPGEYGKRAPRPPGLPGGRGPTPLEESAINGSGVSDPIEPGAPYSDPCPPDATTRVYNLTVFQTTLQYNDEGSYDDTGRMYALSENVDAIKNGEMRPRPLVLRSNVGDCITINLRNELPPDAEPNEMSIHVHFVGFDVLGSDGLALGWNYDSGAEPVGDIGEETRPIDPVTGNVTYRWYADEQGTIFWHDHLSGIEEGMHGTSGTMIVEPRNSTWLDPYTNQTIRAGTRARIKNPNGKDFREQLLMYQDYTQLHNDVDTTGGSRKTVQINPPHTQVAEGEALGLPDQGVSAVNYANAPLYWRNNRRSPSNPAHAFSSYRHGDPQTPIIESYRGDPVRIRLVQATFEEQHSFMLQGHRWRQEWGDPDSPRIASQTLGVSEQFEFHVESGGLSGPADTAGTQYVPGLGAPDAEPVREDMPVTDYRWGSPSTMDLWNGMWGVYRVWQTPAEHLKPLPDRGYPTRAPSPSADDDADGRIGMDELPPFVDTRSLSDVRGTARDTSTLRSPVVVEGTGTAPPKPSGPGEPCPPGTEVETYDVTVFRTDITYNSYGDHDPAGIVYALSENVDAIKTGEKPVTPLVLRANKGECVHITLTNELNPNASGAYPSITNDAAVDAAEAYEHPRMNVIVEWPPSSRTSLFMTNVKADMQGSGGLAIGMNHDSTVAAGESKTYRFHVTQEGGRLFWDGADIRGHRHHGAYGMLIVEPEGSRWLDPETGEPIRTGTRAIIDPESGEPFREFALLMADGHPAVNADGTRPSPRAIPDPEDQAFGLINYRSEPFVRRLGTTAPFSRRPLNATDERESMVFSSRVHGAPDTPVFRAYEGDRVVFRVGQPAEQKRGLSFHIAGHQFRHFWRDDESPREGIRGGISPGKVIEIEPVNGAGGFQDQPGDYLIQPMKLDNVESGMWGIFRVLDEDASGPLEPLPDEGSDTTTQAALTSPRAMVRGHSAHRQ